MLQRELFRLIEGVYRPFITKINTELMKYQLFNSQYRIMHLLHGRENMTFQEIARVASIEKPSASNIIHKLIKLGYVETKEGADKREKHVFITEEGNRVYEEVEEMINGIAGPMFEGVSEEEQKIMMSILRQVKHKLEK